MPEPAALDLAPGVRVVWDTEAVRELAPSGASEPRRLWTLEGSLDEYSLLRVLSGAVEDGRLVLFAAVRPREAREHGEELTAAVVIGPEGPKPADEALLSTEYAEDGSPRRITVELWFDDEDYPLRGAGDATAVASQERGEDGFARAGAALSFRFEGGRGTASYEITRRA